MHTTNFGPALQTSVFPCSMSSSFGTFQVKQCFIHDLVGLSQQLYPSASCSTDSAASPGHETQIGHSETIYSEMAEMHRDELGWSMEG